MKKLALLFGLMLLGIPSLGLTQPDVRDSVILESKTVATDLDGHPAFTVRVSITNKDSLVYMTLALKESTIIGSAYALISRYPLGMYTFTTVIQNLTTTLNSFGIHYFTQYNGVSPDHFIVGAGFDPANLSTIEPPNFIRKPIWEIKFDHTTVGGGQILLDAAILPGHATTMFTNTAPQDILVNFVPSVVTVLSKGDLNFDFSFSPADLVWQIKCILSNIPPQRGLGACDMNCDGERTMADVVLMINAVFLGEDFPC